MSAASAAMRIDANGHVDQVINVGVEDDGDGDDDDIWMKLYLVTSLYLGQVS
jgi:hypothetical protein